MFSVTVRGLSSITSDTATGLSPPCSVTACLMSLRPSILRFTLLVTDALLPPAATTGEARRRCRQFRTWQRTFARGDGAGKTVTDVLSALNGMHPRSGDSSRGDACGPRRLQSSPGAATAAQVARRSGQATDGDIRRPATAVARNRSLCWRLRGRRTPASDATPMPARASRSSRSGTCSMSMPTGRPGAERQRDPVAAVRPAHLMSVPAIHLRSSPTSGTSRRRYSEPPTDRGPRGHAGAHGTVAVGAPSEAGDPRRVVGADHGDERRDRRRRPAPPAASTRRLSCWSCANRERTIRYSHAPDAICSYTGDPGTARKLSMVASRAPNASVRFVGDLVARRQHVRRDLAVGRPW